MTAAGKQAVIFDFDGTLADTAPDMIAALNRWLAQRSRPPVPLEKMRTLCSGGARALLGQCGTGAEPMEKAVADYLTCYEQTGYQNTQLFAGIAEVLTALNNTDIIWGVATNKPRKYFASIAERLLVPYAPAALIARDERADLPPKPHPATLLAAKARCGTAAVVYVGDDLCDGQAAEAAAMPFIAVTWGYWREEQWQVENTPAIAATVSTPAELIATISQLSNCQQLHLDSCQGKNMP